MSKFGYLKRYDINEETLTRFPLSAIEVNGVSPVLLLAPATEANKGYFNALLLQAKKAARQLQKNPNQKQSAILDQNRTMDRALYGEHVVKGWENLCDNEGNEVPYSAEEAGEFINSLPNWLFDQIRNFAASPANHIAHAQDADMDEVEDTAKN